jgi:hypothetical protein
MNSGEPSLRSVTQGSWPRPRWLRFSLRMLLMLVTVCGVWLGVKVNQARRQKEAVVVLRELGTIVYYEHQRTDTNPRVFSVNKDLDLPRWLRDLTGDDFFQSVVLLQFQRPVTDDDLVHLEVLPHIEQLSFSNGSTRRNSWIDAGAKITDAGMAHLPRPGRLNDFCCNNMSIGDGFIKSLSNSARLEKLVLGDTDLTERGLGALRRLMKLRVLSITDPDLGDEALAAMPQMPALEFLQIDSWRVTDAGLANLIRYPSLAKVYLSNTTISDAGLEHLAELPVLRALNLEGTRVRGPGLRHIAPLVKDWLSLKRTEIDDAALRELQCAEGLLSLDLEQTAVTDAGLVHLYDLPRLTQISLEGTQVTDRGIAALTKAMPRMYVSSAPE